MLQHLYFPFFGKIGHHIFSWFTEKLKRKFLHFILVKSWQQLPVILNYNNIRNITQIPNQTTSRKMADPDRDVHITIKPVRSPIKPSYGSSSSPSTSQAAKKKILVKRKRNPVPEISSSEEQQLLNEESAKSKKRKGSDNQLENFENKTKKTLKRIQHLKRSHTKSTQTDPVIWPIHSADTAGRWATV